MEKNVIFTVYNKKELKKDINVFGTIKNMLSYAFEGLASAYHDERSLLVHTSFLSLQIILGLYFKISSMEWISVLIVVFLTIGAEVVNTAIENIVDLITTDYNPLAKNAKDLGSAFVLLMGTLALVVGLIIFLPKVLELFRLIP